MDDAGFQTDSTFGVCSMLAFNADILAILVGFNLDVHMQHVMPDYYTAFTPDAFMSRHIGFGSVGAAIGRRQRVASNRTVTEVAWHVEVALNDHLIRVR